MAGTLTISTLSDGTNSTSSTNCIQGSAKAWVTFTGITPSCVIQASYNVSSVTYLSTGNYQVNFTNAMTDANYAVSGAASTNTGALGPRIFVVGSGQYSNYLKTTSAFKCQGFYYDGNLYDCNYVYAVVNR